MPYYYWPENITRIEHIFTYVNYTTGYIFGMLILMAVFTSIFFWQKAYYDIERCFATASFISLIISILLFILTLVPEYVIYFFIGLNAVALIFLFKQ